VAPDERDGASAAAGLTAREASVVNGTGTEAAGISVDGAGNGTATVWRCG
jgi:hypothetical protein